MPGKRKPAALTRLLRKRSVAIRKSVKAAERLAAARAAHDPSVAHPETWSSLNPWLAGCPDCVREQDLARALHGTPRFVSQEQLTILERVAHAAERAHKQRLVGQAKTAVIRRTKPPPNVEAILRYCRENGLSPKQRGVSKRIHADLQIPQRNVQRVLKTINKK